MKYKVSVSDSQTYLIEAFDETCEAQVIWMALTVAGWADHPYTVSQCDAGISVHSERIASALTIRPFP